MSNLSEIGDIKLPVNVVSFSSSVSSQNEMLLVACTERVRMRTINSDLDRIIQNLPIDGRGSDHQKVDVV